MTIDKTFSGDIEGTSQGQMLTAMGGVPGSAGYVAVERIEGTLHGKRGSFALLHKGIMDRGAPSLSVVIVPDSGTNELVGISGTFNIIIENKVHAFELDYQIKAQG